MSDQENPKTLEELGFTEDVRLQSLFFQFGFAVSCTLFLDFCKRQERPKAFAKIFILQWRKTVEEHQKLKFDNLNKLIKSGEINNGKIFNSAEILGGWQDSMQEVIAVLTAMVEHLPDESA